jgi:hypothetical protein
MLPDYLLPNYDIGGEAVRRVSYTDYREFPPVDRAPPPRPPERTIDGRAI